MDQKREGDGKTPIGIYPIKRIYAKTRVQHFSFPISVFTKSSHWDGDPNSKSYNQFLRHPKKGAVRLWDSPIYALFLVIEHNTEKANQKGAGSMLFVHPWEEPRPTSGCLGLPLEDWKEIAKHLDPKHKPKLIIQEKESPLWSPYSWPISGQETAE
ncbi:L,D-transpeptidase catalytic domain protein [Leptospira ryugenii]|uniref:L,D-transpeptidase catalytic domain protein n=2 Tax=Leptospira ryugenii TaxID=1917863 RepID=A0A2P2DWS4_9LEPT|nr:L,D-transpeptidase catalytic domain protein [Leptospira ryugenii]